MKFNNKLNGNTIKSREFAILKQFLLCACYLHDLATAERVYSIHNSLSMESLAFCSPTLPLSTHYCIFKTLLHLFSFWFSVFAF